MKRVFLIYFTLLSIMCAGLVSAAVDAARVNGVGISRNALEVATDSLIRNTSYHRDISEDKRNEFRKKALNGLIDGELQVQDAVAKGIQPDKQLVKTRMDQLISQFKSKKDYRKALNAAGFTEDEQLAQIEKSVLIDAVIDKTITGPSQATEGEIKEYYEKNKDAYKEPETVRLRILSSRDEAKAREALENILEGEEFSSVAAAFSEDQYRIKGGDIGFVSRGAVLPELEREAFKLKNGETSGLIQADKQWFIVKAEMKRPERVKTFEECREGIKKDLEMKRFAQLMEVWMTELRAKAKIEILLLTESVQTDDHKPAELQQP